MQHVIFLPCVLILATSSLRRYVFFHLTHRPYWDFISVSPSDTVGLYAHITLADICFLRRFYVIYPHGSHLIHSFIYANELEL